MTLHIFNPEHDIALASGLANFTAPHAGRQLRHDLGFLPALWASEGDIIMVDDVDQARRSLERLTHRLHTLQQTQSLLRANSEFTPGKLRVYSGQTQTPSEDTPRIELTYPQAIAYLRGEALQLPPDTPRGFVAVCFQCYPLGTAKNIGTRANNLYPKEWRIKTTHIPTDYEAILRHT